jgi:DNA-binding Xre family transcriptional regulator
MGQIVATLEDMERMKPEIIQAIREISQTKSVSEKKWIRTKEARAILGISSSTLQTLRIKGEIPFSKIGGIIYFPVEGIQKLLDENLRDK